MCKSSGSSVNIYYLEESIKTYESLIAGFQARRDLLLARRRIATGSMVMHIDESIRINDTALDAMVSALTSAQESLRKHREARCVHPPWTSGKN